VEVRIAALLDSFGHVQDQVIIIAKLSQGLPRYIQPVLTDEYIEDSQESSNCELSVSYHFLIWVIPSNNLLPPSQVSLIDRHMKRLMLKSIEFGMAQKTVMVSVIHSKDSSESPFAILRKLADIQIVERRKRIKNSLLRFQKDFVNSE